MKRTAAQTGAPNSGGTRETCAVSRPEPQNRPLADAVDRLDVGTETGRVLRFTLPMPLSGLSPNAGTHRLALHGLKQQYRNLVLLLMREQIGPAPWPRFERARLAITAVYPNHRHWTDADNLQASFKAGTDALCDEYRKVKGRPAILVRTGILPNDSPACLDIERIQYEVDPLGRGPCLRVTLTEIPT